MVTIKRVSRFASGTMDLLVYFLSVAILKNAQNLH